MVLSTIKVGILRALIMQGFKAGGQVEVYTPAHYLKICTPPQIYREHNLVVPTVTEAALANSSPTSGVNDPMLGEIQLCCCKHQATPRKAQRRHTYRTTHHSLLYLYRPYLKWTQHPPATHQSFPPERHNVSSFYGRFMHGGNQQNKTHRT
jgi:hypothetical protein